MSARGKGWGVDRRVRFKTLDRGGRVSKAVKQRRHEPANFGDRYAAIRRYGQEVLHMLANYYSDDVLKAAQDEDIEPFGTLGYIASTKLFRGNLYLGAVSSGPNGNQRTVEMIKRNAKIYAGRRNVNNFNPRRNTVRSLTLTTQPVISQEIADKGVEKARQAKPRRRRRRRRKR